MPQFNPEWFASQIFWLAITFIILYLLMSRIALPRVAEILQERQEKVEEDLAKAERLRQEAQDVSQAYEQSLAEARAQAQKILREAQEDIARHQSDRHQAFTQELNKKVEEAEQRIEAAKQDAMKNLDSAAAEVAQSAALKLMGGRIGKAKAETAVKDAIGGKAPVEEAS